jgi:hypothetical protein
LYRYQKQAKELLNIDVSLTQDEKERGILTPEIMWKFGRIGSSAISPDGKYLAYTTTTTNLQENKGLPTST